MKKIIVTGHNGFIGPHLVRLLKEAGHYVIGIDTNFFDDECKFSDGQKPDREIAKDVRNIAKMVGEVVPDCKVVITGEHGSDSRSYRVDFTKIARELPAFKPKWTLKPAIEDIYRQYKAFGMDDERFNGRYFSRLKQLEYLINKGAVDEKLY